MLQSKPINDFYTIFSDGRLYSNITKKFIIPDVSNTYGYIRVTLYKPYRVRWLLHRLVAEFFLDKVDGKTFVNHLDGDKTNNDVSNLEWVTQSENEKHAFETGLKPTVSCTINGVTYKSLRLAANSLGISYTGLCYRLDSGGFKNYIKNA